MKRKIAIPISIFLATILLLGGYYFMNNKSDVEIQTDREPIVKRFPLFPQTEELYWVATEIGTRTVGPSSLELSIWAKLDEREFDSFVKSADFDNSEDVVPRFVPTQLEKEYHWKKMTAQYVFETKKLGTTQFTPTIYFDTEERTIYIEAVGAN